MKGLVWFGHITYIVAENFKFAVPLALFTVYRGGEVPRKRHMGEGGWLKTSEYRHMGERGLKLLKEPSYDI